MENEQLVSPENAQPSPADQSAKDGRLTKKQRRALKKQQKREERAQAERGRKTKTWVAWLAVVAAVALGLWWLVASSNSTDSAAVPPATEVTDNDWVKGEARAPATIIEYSDFQCPACAAYFPMVKQLLGEFGDSVRFAYRHFPLRGIHANAAEAAQAAEAAGMQGRFWDMHDLLFERQTEWSSVRNPFDLFAQYAQQLGLNAEQFKTDYESSATKSKVKAHEAAGRKLGVAGTPTFVLNGEVIENPRGYDAFRALVVPLVGELLLDDAQGATTTEEGL